MPSDASHRIHHLHLPVIIGIHSRKRAHRNKSSVILRGPIKGITDVERDEEGGRGRETWRARPASEVQRRAAKKVQPDRSGRQTDFERAQIQLGDLARLPSLPPEQ